MNKLIVKSWVVAVLAVGCAAETGGGVGSTPEPSQTSEKLGAGECAAAMDEQTSLLAESRACTVDADCTSVVAFCNFQNRKNCGGLFAVSRTMDMARFNELEEGLMSCVPSEDCGTCNMAWNDEPTCVGGLCTGPWE